MAVEFNVDAEAGVTRTLLYSPIDLFSRAQRFPKESLLPMDDKLRVLRLVVASPGDVKPEREILPRVVDEVNQNIANPRGLLLQLHRWETDSFPGFHPQGPQGLIDPILKIEDCDILIGIFWKRFGTPTTDAKSGTEHEFRAAYEAWKKNQKPQIMVYFSRKPYAPQSKEETDQAGLVLQFKNEFPREGLWWDYKNKTEFERLIRNHLTNFLASQFPLDKPAQTDKPTPAPPGAQQDSQQARKSQEQAAAAGNSQAMTQLGYLYQSGYGVPQDYEQARKLYEKASAAGNSQAMTQLGFLYQNGFGVSRDYEQARSWYEKSAAAGNAQAMTQLGFLYQNGFGVPRDYEQARSWYEKAAAAGNTQAMTQLGYLYQSGYGVPVDYAQARKWYEQAAAGGSTQAMTQLGYLYQSGYGVPKDYEQARKWYEKAATGDNS
jgi:TPR repeat protein